MRCTALIVGCMYSRSMQSKNLQIILYLVRAELLEDAACFSSVLSMCKTYNAMWDMSSRRRPVIPSPQQAMHVARIVGSCSGYSSIYKQLP